MPHPFIIALVLLLPMAGFLLPGLLGKTINKKAWGILGTLVMLAATLLALYTAYGYFFQYGKVNDIYQKIIPWQYRWLEFSPGLSIDMGVILDPISVMMMVVVTFVSLMVHLFSITYMKDEERFSTYYAFLSLFTFSMLGLVLAANLFQLFIFWELVGVSSFLLIGFYYDRPGAVAACKKAFIVTRFADLGFLIGILVLSFYSGTLDFSMLLERLTSPESIELKTALTSSFLGISALSWGLLLVFTGGAGKSAMFPLHIWLPDAMEGPTPVSALIHAATMVVAGVYLVARLFPVFALHAPQALQMVAYVGAISALLAAVIACTQTDIKRILAYSTISQIGFMMFALGVSKFGGEKELGFTASMFHLFTHAMFKALLFLGAGTIIHFVHSNEIKDMGGLHKSMPVTHITFLIACLAIAGVPPFAGFFSKEEILLAAYQGNKTIYWVGLITSGITAFYMFRLYFTIFWNKPTTQAFRHRREGGVAMLLPLILLAIGAALGGFIPFGKFVSADGRLFHTHFDAVFSIAPVSVSIAGILLAMRLYKIENDASDRMAHTFRKIYLASYNKFYFDELYLFVTKRILFNLVGRSAAWFDKNIVDGLVNFTGNVTEAVANKIKGVQSGKVQQYAIYFLVSAIALILLFIYA